MWKVSGETDAARAGRHGCDGMGDVIHSLRNMARVLAAANDVTDNATDVDRARDTAAGAIFVSPSHVQRSL